MGLFMEVPLPITREYCTRGWTGEGEGWHKDRWRIRGVCMYVVESATNDAPIISASFLENRHYDRRLSQQQHNGAIFLQMTTLFPLDTVCEKVVAHQHRMVV
jgi:hypothetical protein